MVAHDARPLPALRPDPRRHPFLADARFVLEPDFDRARQRLGTEQRPHPCLEARHERSLPPRVGPGMDRPSRDKAKPGPSQHHTGTAVRIINDPEGLLDFADHVLNPPARYTVPLKIGTRLDPQPDLGNLRIRQPPVAAAAGTVRKPLETLRVVAQHPVAQDLKRHALRPRRLRARRPIHDHRDRTRATGLLRITAALRQIMEFVRTVLGKGYRRRRTHHHPPIVSLPDLTLWTSSGPVTTTYWKYESI